MAGVTELCNQALALVGGSLIDSLQASSTESRLCNLYYPTARVAVLNSNEWTFARKRVQLDAISPAEPVPGFANTFLLPDDTLRVTKVSHSPDHLDMHRVVYDLTVNEEGLKIIAARESIIYIKYIFNQDNFEMFSESFVLALAYKMATLLAIPIAHSSTLKASLDTAFEAHRKEAAANDGRQLQSERIRAKQFIDVRLTGGRAFIRH